jgi:hypothetical protein
MNWEGAWSGSDEIHRPEVVHFPVAAFLDRNDLDFWARWDHVAERYQHDARAELSAQLDWIGELAGRPGYRGCPQINVAAEFPDEGHPARKVAKAHKLELRQRLLRLAERLDVDAPQELAGDLAVLIKDAATWLEDHRTIAGRDCSNANDEAWQEHFALAGTSGIQT